MMKIRVIRKQIENVENGDVHKFINNLMSRPRYLFIYVPYDDMDGVWGYSFGLLPARRVFWFVFAYSAGFDKPQSSLTKLLGHVVKK